MRNPQDPGILPPGPLCASQYGRRPGQGPLIQLKIWESNRPRFTYSSAPRCLLYSLR